MKTITPKDAFKLVLFLLILFSAKTFSQFPSPNDSNADESVTRIGDVKKVENTQMSSPTSRAHEMCYKDSNAATGEVTSKFGG